MCRGRRQREKLIDMNEFGTITCVGPSINLPLRRRRRRLFFASLCLGDAAVSRATATATATTTSTFCEAPPAFARPAICSRPITCPFGNYRYRRVTQFGLATDTVTVAADICGRRMRGRGRGDVLSSSLDGGVRKMGGGGGVDDSFAVPRGAPRRLGRRQWRVGTSTALPVAYASGDGDATYGDATLMDETFEELYGEAAVAASYSEGGNSEHLHTSEGGDADEHPPPHLPKWLTDRCAALGYVHPTLVQKRALDSVLLGGNDAVVHAQTGSGKTLAYLLPLLSSIDPTRRSVQAIVVVPTRELGLQVTRVARRLAAASGSGSRSRDSTGEGEEMRRSDKIVVMSVLQGSANRRQRAWAWAEPPHVVVGTPTELSKMVTLGGMKYHAVKFVVVDEVDACLLKNVGGNKQDRYYKIGDGSSPLHVLLSRYLSPTYVGEDEARLEEAASDSSVALTASANTLAEGGRGGRISHGTDRQTVFASATVPQHRHFVRQCLANKWTVREPVHVRASPGELVPPRLDHTYVTCSTSRAKLGGLRRILRREAGRGRLTRALIFCDPGRPMEEMARAVAKDFDGGIVWTEGSGDLGRDVGDGVGAVVSVLRYEDSLGARAAAMDAFRGGGAGAGIREASTAQRADTERVDDRGEAEVSVNGEAGLGPVRIMFSTDLAARGLDVEDVSHVINFDLPDGGDAYVHRGGRAGRMGRPGSVISLIIDSQEFVLERMANELFLDVRCVARQQQRRQSPNR